MATNTLLAAGDMRRLASAAVKICLASRCVTRWGDCGNQVGDGLDNPIMHRDPWTGRTRAYTPILNGQPGLAVPTPSVKDRPQLLCCQRLSLLICIHTNVRVTDCRLDRSLVLL